MNSQYTTSQDATNEYATSDYATSQDATNEYATSDYATSQDATNEYATNRYATGENFGFDHAPTNGSTPSKHQLVSSTEYGCLVSALTVLCLLEFGASLHTIKAIVKRRGIKQSTEIIITALCVTDMASAIYWLVYGLSVVTSPGFLSQRDFLVSNHFIQNSIVCYGCHLLLLASLERYQRMRSRETPWTRYVTGTVAALISSVTIALITMIIAANGEKRLEAMIFIGCITLSTYAGSLAIAGKSYVNSSRSIQPTLSRSKRRETRILKMIVALNAFHCFLSLVDLTSSLFSRIGSFQHMFYHAVVKAIWLPLLSNSTLFYLIFSTRFRTLWFGTSSELTCCISDSLPAPSTKIELVMGQSSLQAREPLGQAWPGEHASNPFTDNVHHQQTQPPIRADRMNADPDPSTPTQAQGTPTDFGSLSYSLRVSSSHDYKTQKRNIRSKSASFSDFGVKSTKKVRVMSRTSCPDLCSLVNTCTDGNMHRDHKRASTVYERPRSISSIKSAWVSLTSRHDDYTDTTGHDFGSSVYTSQSMSPRDVSELCDRATTTSGDSVGAFTFSNNSSQVNPRRDIGLNGSRSIIDRRLKRSRWSPSSSARALSQQDVSSSSESSHKIYSPWATRVRKRSLMSIMEDESNAAPFHNDLHLVSMSTIQTSSCFSPKSFLSSSFSLPSPWGSSGTRFSFKQSYDKTDLETPGPSAQSVNGDYITHPCSVASDNIDPVSFVYLGQTKDTYDPVSFVYLGPAP